MVKEENSKVGLNKNAWDKKKWREGVSSWHGSQLTLFHDDDDDYFIRY